MPVPWFDPLLFATSCLCGAGLLFALWLGYACERPGRLSLLLNLLLAVTALAAAAFAGLAATALQPLAIWGSAAAVAGLYVLLVVLPSPLLARCLMATSRLAQRRPSRHAATVGVLAACPFLALALVYGDIPAVEELREETVTASRAVIAEPAGDAESPLTTDLGRPVRMLVMPADACTPSAALLASQDQLLTRSDLHDVVIYLPLGWQNTNCHGFVFTASRYWIGGSQVDAILEDNGYQPVAAVRPDDIAVYRSADGTVMHTGIVRGTASDGVILVESKWGQGGRFVHRHDRQPYSDTECTFYRSPRQGHLLRGLYPVPSTEQPAPPSTQPPQARGAVVGL